MEVNTLVSFLEKHNEAAIILTEKCKPKGVLFLYLKENEDNLFKLKQYYKDKYPNVKFSFVQVEEKFNNLMKVLEHYNSKENIYNLTSIKTLVSLIIYHFTIMNGLRALYVNIPNEEIIDFKGGNEIKLDTNKLDIPIVDIIKSNGGEILIHSTEMADKKNIAYLAECIAKNLELWEKKKFRLYDNELFTHNSENVNKTYMNLSVLDKEEKKLAIRLLGELQRLNQISYKEEKKEFYEVRFLNEYIKSFIFKSGSWLEVYTKNVMEEIEGIDDIKSGLLFLWNEDIRRVKNELDVVAVKDAKLICISCKDSARYDEISLNELQVYSDLLGGENSIKILVCTKEPLKSSVRSRAEEMGIHIVCFDGNKEFFKNRLEKIIKVRDL